MHDDLADVRQRRWRDQADGGPGRLVGNDQLVIQPGALQVRLQLFGNNERPESLVELIRILTHAEHGDEPVLLRRQDFAPNDGVLLRKVNPPLVLADEHVLAQPLQHLGRNFARIRAPRLGMHILRAQRYAASLQDLRHLRQPRKRWTHDSLHTCLRAPQ